MPKTHTNAPTHQGKGVAKALGQEHGPDHHDGRVVHEETNVVGLACGRREEAHGGKGSVWEVFKQGQRSADEYRGGREREGGFSMSLARRTRARQVTMEIWFEKEMSELPHP